MMLFNTLSRKLEKFTPIQAGKAAFYGCGPTVYNFAHIGNLRAYITHDILVRSLRRFGYDVNYVMNITDVGHLSGDNDEGEDKMLKSAEERGKSVLEIADFYTKAFFTDTERLNIGKPNIVCKATEHINEMIELIKKIEENGYTYVSGGNVYFDISKFPAYGNFARLQLDELKSGSRIEEDQNKRNAGDFVLWFTKSKFENQALLWDSPWGQGYPGWHIECSAMSIKYLGEQFDIHAGGIDHIPVHHTNEIAQSEAATGKSPWVKYWIHNEFLVIDKGKMSKSSGEFLTLQSLIDQSFDPLDYRYFLLGAHYRSQLQFSFEALEGAKNARKSLKDRIKKLAGDAAASDAAGEAATGKAAAGEAAAGSKDADTYIKAFNAALEDDLSTPRALAALWGLIRDQEIDPKMAIKAALDMDEVLGFRLKEVLESKDEGLLVDTDFANEIEKLIAERAKAKLDKDYKKADEIRASLVAKGIVLEDGPKGTIWRRA